VNYERKNKGAFMKHRVYALSPSLPAIGLSWVKKSDIVSAGTIFWRTAANFRWDI